MVSIKLRLRCLRSNNTSLSPFGRDMKGIFTVLQSLLMTKATNFTLRLAICLRLPATRYRLQPCSRVPYSSRRNIIDLFIGALVMRIGVDE